jgi:hypothetical protein
MAVLQSYGVQCDSLAAKPKYSPINFLIFVWLPMKIDMNEIYIYLSRTIIPLNEVNSSNDVETRPPNRRLSRVIACAANMYAAEQRVFYSSIPANGFI